ncbi:MAG: hypothetical protein JNG90_07900 [Planctomycetaceae bacterium]|nr:hypothetical protein [Planctomycetaceae bacterium]
MNSQPTQWQLTCPRRLVATAALCCWAGAALAAEPGDLVTLRAEPQPAVTTAAAAEWWNEAPQLRPVANWMTMSQAQSGLPQGYYAGAELFFARASGNTPGVFATGTNMNGGSNPNVQVHNFVFDYQASPRLYVGWRSPDTGDAFQFSYWHYDNLATDSFTVTNPNQAFIAINWLGDGDNGFMTVGDTIASHYALNFNVYDIEYFKSLAFAGGRWLITGSAGARIANVDQRIWTDVAGIDQNGGGGGGGSFQAITYGENLSFLGAGPRLTLEARRNLGAWFSLYGRGGYAILLGAAENNGYMVSQLSPDSFNAYNNGTATVTVADIEFGASWRANDLLVISAGYLFQSWQGLSGNIGQQVVTSGADFISFDGLVVRAVLNY